MKTVENCKDTLLKNLVIYDNIAFAGNDTLVARDQPLYLNANGYPDEKYFWHPKKGLSDEPIVNPVALNSSDKLYFLHSVTKEGCVKDSKVLVKRMEGPALYIATAFTPNDDKLNDTLHVFPVGIKQFLHFSIFNRYGSLIFRTTDPLKGWDGSYNGQKISNETLIAIAEAIDYRGNPLIQKGTVVVIRN